VRVCMHVYISVFARAQVFKTLIMAQGGARASSAFVEQEACYYWE
jgi:hypothetical protein